MRSGVGAVCPLTLGFLLDLDETFFFFAVVEELWAAPGWPAPDTTGAALTRSAAPKMDKKIRLLIVCLPGSITARELEQLRPDKPCRTDRCPIAAGL